MYMYMCYSLTVYIEQRGAYPTARAKRHLHKSSDTTRTEAEGEGTRGGVALDEIENGAKRNANKVKI